MTSQTRTARLLDAVETYFEALHRCDADLLDDVFHPAANLFDVDGDDVLVDPLESWKQDVAARPSPASAGQARATAIESIDWLWERAAVVRVRLWILDQLFVDHLCFVDGPSGFRIVAKVWHDATDDMPLPPVERDAGRRESRPEQSQ